jgi:hypothetical protein
MVERRKAFAAEMRTIVGYVDAISAIAIGRETGVLE